MSSVEETMAYDAFEAVVRAGDASDDASLASTTRSAADEEVANARLVESRRALARAGALADVSDAYGAYVSLMRSGLWRDIAPRRASEDEGGSSDAAPDASSDDDGEEDRRSTSSDSASPSGSQASSRRRASRVRAESEILTDFAYTNLAELARGNMANLSGSHK